MTGDFFIDCKPFCDTTDLKERDICQQFTHVFLKYYLFTELPRSDCRRRGDGWGGWIKREWSDRMDW